MPTVFVLDDTCLAIEGWGALGDEVQNLALAVGERREGPSGIGRSGRSREQPRRCWDCFRWSRSSPIDTWPRVKVSSAGQPGTTRPVRPSLMLWPWCPGSCGRRRRFCGSAQENYVVGVLREFVERLTDAVAMRHEWLKFSSRNRLKRGTSNAPSVDLAGISRPKRSEKHRFGTLQAHCSHVRDFSDSFSRKSYFMHRVNGLLGTRLGAFPLHSIEHPPRLEPGLIELDRRCKNGDSNRLTVDVLSTMNGPCRSCIILSAAVRSQVMFGRAAGRARHRRCYRHGARGRC